MAENTEVFIETVRSYVFLYDTTHEYYKNMLKKSEAWNEISKTLGIAAETAKQKWKNLRESYLRYKFRKGETGQPKKYHKWPWSTHMNFLDYTLKPRSHSSNIPSEGLTETEETRLSETENLLMSHDTQQTDASSEHSSATLLVPARPKEKKKKPYSHSSTENCPDDVDKVIDFLSNKRSKQDLDGIDYLFLSSAATFKKISPLTQATMKIKLATLFAENEIKELEAHPTSAPKAPTPHSRPSSAHSSHYSQYSNETEPYSRPPSAHSSHYTQYPQPYSRASSVNPSNYTQHSDSETSPSYLQNLDSNPRSQTLKESHFVLTKFCSGRSSCRPTQFSRHSAKDVYEGASDMIQEDPEDNSNYFNLSYLVDESRNK